EAVALVGASESAVVKAVFSGRDMEFAKRVASKVAGLERGAVIGVVNGDEGAVAAARKPGSELNAGSVLREVL
ncbi:MAG: hypothetical protein V4555_21775, partial [Acidobacteriota bacterium]